METRTLDAHLRVRGWSRSELARRVGVSRQAVSRWFRGGKARLRGDHLLRVSEVLGVPVEELARPLPALGEEHDRIEAQVLWDRQYPDLVDFAIAVNRWEPVAVGRFVEVYGLYAAAKAMGSSVWSRFPEYCRYIHPVRRRQLEALVRWRLNRAVS